ncbi:MAG: YlxR family protein [Fimbriimonadaceae bacterium]
MACRERHPQAELLRIRYDRDGNIEVHNAKSKAGRSVYLCQTETCVERALSKGALQKRLGRTTLPEQLKEDIRNACRQK